MGVYIRTERGKERIMELVLYYGAEDPEMKKNVMMMKSVLVRMGVRIRNVSPALRSRKKDRSRFR